MPVIESKTPAAATAAILGMANGVPAGVSPSGGGFFYVLNGALRWVGSAGSDTQVAGSESITLNPNRIGNSGGFAPVDYGGLPVFRDRMMEARGFMTIADASVYAPLDTAGWPTTDFQTYLSEVQGFSSQPSWNSGTYKCGYTSKNGGLETITGFSATITNKVVVGNTVTFDLTATGGATNFRVTGTTGGVTNVFAMLPGYNTDVPYNISGDQATLFTTEYVNRIKLMGVQRALDWTNALFNRVAMTSANRNTPANTKGHKAWGETTYFNEAWPLEWLIALCNQTNTSPYWHIPLNADATYVSACANLINSTLHSWLPVYVELANELWNGVGVGGSYYNGVVNAYNAANPGVLDYDSTSDQTTLNARYLAVRLKGIYDGFNAVFGSRMGTQVFIVVAWQTGGNGLDFLNKFYLFMVHQYGSVAPYIHYNAIAPYMTRDNSGIPSDGVDHINSNDSIAQIQAHYTTNGTYRPFLAFSESQYIQGREHGLLGLITYESGREIAGETTAVVNYGAAMLDSGMSAVVQNNIQAMVNSGYSLILNTFWGVSNSNSVLDPGYAMATDYTSFVASGSAIYNALTSHQSGLPAPTRNVVSGPGSTVDAINYNDNAVGLSAVYPYFGQLDPYAKSPKYGIGGYFGYVINCTAPGTYALAVKFDSNISGNTNCTCNGTTVATGVAIPSGLSNGSVNIGSVTLSAGPNRIILGNGTTYNSIQPKQFVFS